MEGVTGSFEDPVDIRTAITIGQLQVIGIESMDGQQALHLRVTSAPRPMRGAMDPWVDRESYLSVRLSIDKAGSPVTQDYTSLARTPENLASLTVTHQPASATSTSRSTARPPTGSADISVEIQGLARPALQWGRPRANTCDQLGNVRGNRRRHELGPQPNHFIARRLPSLRQRVGARSAGPAMSVVVRAVSPDWPAWLAARAGPDPGSLESRLL